MDLTLVSAFVVTGIGFAFLPGADWGYAIAIGARGRSIWPAVSGLTLGYVVLTLATAGGIAALVASSPVILSVITAVGAAYLTWLGIQTLRGAHAARYEAGSTPTVSGGRVFTQGLATSGTNPKGLLLFVALLPQFVSTRADWSLGLQLIALGVMFTLMVFVVYTMVAFTSKRVLAQRAGLARYVSYASGVLMLTLAALLALERFGVWPFA